MAAFQYILSPKRAPRHLCAQQLYGRKASKASQAKRSEPVCGSKHITQNKFVT